MPNSEFNICQLSIQENTINTIKTNVADLNFFRSLMDITNQLTNHMLTEIGISSEQLTIVEVPRGGSLMAAFLCMSEKLADAKLATINIGSHAKKR